MAVKYKIEYFSVSDVLYEVEISNPEYEGPVLPLTGRVVYQMAKVDNYYDPLRAKRLKLNLIATVEQDLEDLLIEDERFWRVELFRNGSKIFFGYLSSELSQQSFSADRWELQIEALGPLGFLQDIAYDRVFVAELEKSTNPISRVIANCLVAGFAEQAEAFDIVQVIPYEVQLRSPDDLLFTTTDDNSFAIQGLIDDVSFLDRDTETIKSCQDILTELLEALQLTITQVDGTTWHVIPYYADASLLPANTINRFDFSGNLIGLATDNLVPKLNAVVHDSNTDVATEVLLSSGSNVYKYERSVDRITTNYEFEFRKILNDNPELLTRVGIIKVFDNTFDNTFGDTNDNGGFNLPFWGTQNTVGGETILSIQNGFVELISRRAGIGAFLGQAKALSSTEIRVVGGEQLSLRVEITLLSTENPSIPINLQLYAQLDRDVGSDAFAFFRSGGNNINDAWTPQGDLPLFTFPGEVEISSTIGQKTTITINLPTIPDEGFSGKVKLIIAGIEDALIISSTARVDFAGVSASLNEASGSSTVFEKSKQGLKSEKFDIEYNSALGFILANQFYYDSEGSLNSVSGFQDIFNTRGDNFIPLGSLFSILRMNALQRRKIWTLSAYNFFEPNSLISIPANNVNPFRVIEYDFDTYSNEIRAELEEVTGIEVSGTLTETILQDDDEPNSIK